MDFDFEEFVKSDPLAWDGEELSDKLQETYPDTLRRLLASALQELEENLLSVEKLQEVEALQQLFRSYEAR